MKCTKCGGAIEWGTRQRAGFRNYCGGACRQAAYRNRRRAAPDVLLVEMRALAGRAEALAGLARECPDRFVGRAVQDEAAWVVRRLTGAAGMLDTDPLPFD